MTLGGLALAVGILVDEATVAIENIHTHLADGRSLARAAQRGDGRDDAAAAAGDALHLAVFIPAFFMQGAAHNLFVPLALAVGFSMVASYMLSSTFVPVLSVWLLRNPQHARTSRKRRFSIGCVPGTIGSLRVVMRLRRIVVLSYLVISGAIIFVVGSSLGTEIFPIVDTGQFQFASAGSGGNAHRADRADRAADTRRDQARGRAGQRRNHPRLRRHAAAAIIPINTIYLWSSGSEEAVLQVQLKRGAGIGIEELKERLRQKLPQELPGVRFSVRAERHRQPGDELRRADADRSGGERAEPRREPAVRREAASEIGAGAVAARPGIRAGARLPDRQGRPSTASERASWA